MEELQRRVVKAEATIQQKEQESTELRERLKQFEKRWIEYETKMKTMEEMWQKQMASLQVSFLLEYFSVFNVLFNVTVMDEVNWSDQIKHLFSSFYGALLEQMPFPLPPMTK